MYELRKLRPLAIDEQDVVRRAIVTREELRKRLKKTQDAAERAKRYRIRIRKANFGGDGGGSGNGGGDDDDGETLEPPAKIARSQSTGVLLRDADEKAAEICGIVAAVERPPERASLDESRLMANAYANERSPKATSVFGDGGGDEHDANDADEAHQSRSSSADLKATITRPACVR